MSVQPQPRLGGDQPTWIALLARFTRGEDLSAEQTGWAVREVVEGRADTVRLAAFLAALRTKGETAQELTGVVRALLDSAVPVPVQGLAYDIAGTGGDGTGSMNVSTLAAIVAAATGIKVVKHGGRAASSTTAGSADVIEALGIPLDCTPEQIARSVATNRFSYLFAPRFNPGLRHAVDARRHLGVPTIFNLAAPLINPCLPGHQVVGVADRTRAPMIAEVLARLGRRGLVVSGRDGLDKLTTAATSDIWVVRDGVIRYLELDPADLGLAVADPGSFRGGTAQRNSELAVATLTGARGPLREVVLLNAAALINAGTLTAVDHLPQLREAIARAAEAIDSGAALAILEQARALAAVAGSAADSSNGMELSRADRVDPVRRDRQAAGT